MREFMDIVSRNLNESAIKVDPSVIDSMINYLLNGVYWDQDAVSRYDRLKNMAPSDDIYTMAKDWIESGELPEGDLDEIVESKEFEDVLRRWARARLEKVIWKLQQIPIKDGGYRADRILRVDPSKFKIAKESGHTDLGVYWTYDHASWGADEAPWADYNDPSLIDYMISAIIPPSSVDWSLTALAHMEFSYGDDEYELRAKIGSPIKVLQIQDETGANIDIDGINFTA